MTVTIDSHAELLVLHRALMERHFVDEIHSSDLIGSPVLAAISHQVLDTLIEHEVAAKGSSERAKWREWRELTPQKGVVWRIFLARLCDEDTRDYLKVTPEQQRHKYIRDVASPFVISDETLVELMREVL